MLTIPFLRSCTHWTLLQILLAVVECGAALRQETPPCIAATRAASRQGLWLQATGKLCHLLSRLVSPGAQSFSQVHTKVDTGASACRMWRWSQETLTCSGLLGKMATVGNLMRAVGNLSCFPSCSCAQR